MLQDRPPAEVAVDEHLVAQLLRSQHPDLAALPLRLLGVGWDNVVYRLGAHLCVRVPRRELGARLIASEVQWLPQLEGSLPLPVPTPLRWGQPDDRYPWPWTVCRYVPGRPVGPDGLRTAGQAAVGDLVAFLCALHQPAPPAAPANAFRGVALEQRADAVSRALTAVPLAPAAVRVAEQAFAAGVTADAYAGQPRWLHGDLHNGNILASRGRLTGVIDFGDLCAGDPSTDLAVAWLVLGAQARARLRRELGVPDAAWVRARGWAAFFAVVLAHHSRSEPANAAIAAAALREVAIDDG